MFQNMQKRSFENLIRLDPQLLNVAHNLRISIRSQNEATINFTEFPFIYPVTQGKAERGNL